MAFLDGETFLDGKTKVAFLEEKGEETSDERGWLAMQVRGKALAVRE